MPKLGDRRADVSEYLLRLRRRPGSPWASRLAKLVLHCGELLQEVIRSSNHTTDVRRDVVELRRGLVLRRQLRRRHVRAGIELDLHRLGELLSVDRERNRVRPGQHFESPAASTSTAATTTFVGRLIGF